MHRGAPLNGAPLKQYHQPAEFAGATQAKDPLFSAL
jgi:hypothetical protein